MTLPQLPPVSSFQTGPPPHHSYPQDQHPPQSQQSHFGHPIQPYYSTPPNAPSLPAYGHHPLPPLGTVGALSGASSIPAKRSAGQSTSLGASDSPPKKLGKWTPEEDALAIELRRKGMKWDDISKRLPGRSAISCRLRYQNYSEKRPDWDEEKKNKLARLYNRFKKDMWDMIAKEMGLPWRAVEAMHWQMGCEDMASRANVPVFQPHVAPGQIGTNSKSSGQSTTSQSSVKRKYSSKSPPMSDSSLGPGTINRPRRSSSAASRRRAEVRAVEKTNNSALLPSVDEAGPGRTLRFGGGSSGDGSTSGKEWAEREREASGTSHARSASLSSAKSGRSGRIVTEHVMEEG